VTSLAEETGLSSGFQHSTRIAVAAIGDVLVAVVMLINISSFANS
jgi:hypothetical protein